MPFHYDKSTVYGVWTPGELAEALRKWQAGWNSPAYAFPAVEITIGSHDGFRSLAFHQHWHGVFNGEVYNEDGEFRIIIDLLSLAEDETAPTRFFTDSPGWNGGFSGINYGEQVGTPDSGTQLATVLLWKKQILEAWGRAALRYERVDWTEPVVGAFRIGTGVQVFDSLSEHIVTSEKIAFNGNLVTGPDYQNSVAYAGSSIPSSTVSGGSTNVSVDLLPITQALQDIAKRDITIALDEGRVVVASSGSETIT